MSAFEHSIALAFEPTEAPAEAVSHSHIELVDAVVAKQPPSPVPESVGASAAKLHQAEHPTQADEHVLDQHRDTSVAKYAADSKSTASQEGVAPASKARAPTDGKDVEVAEASTAAVVSEGEGAASAAVAAADVPAHAPTHLAEGTPLVLVAPPMTVGELPTMEKASVPSCAAAAAAAAAAFITDASSTAQAATTGLSASAREEAPISAAAAAPVDGAFAATQAANTGLRPAAKPVDTATEQSDVTESCAFADAIRLLTFAPDADTSAAVPGTTKPPLSTDALAADAVAVSRAVPVTASATQAQATESVAPAHGRPSLVSSSAPTASQVQSAESPATAAEATTAPPPAAAAAAAASTAMLKTVSVPKLPPTSGSTRIGLANRLSSLSKSLLGLVQAESRPTCDSSSARGSRLL